MSVERMKAWLQQTELPKELHIGRHYRNGDTGLTIKTALATLEHSAPGSLNYRAAYMRLYELKQHLTKSSKSK